MIVYPDTSHVVGFALGPANRRYEAALDFERRHAEDDWIWCALLHSAEVFCALRSMAAIGEVPPHHVRSAIRQIERSLAHRDYQRRDFASLEESLSKASGLSAEHGWGQRYTALDTWHVAAALACGADRFVTFGYGVRL